MDALNSSDRITQKDVARALGLTQATVSLALRGDSTIPAVRRAEILEAAQKMGYQPNPMGVALAEYKHTSKTNPTRAAIAWLNLWPQPEQLRSFTEFDRYWQGASKAARNLGYRLEEFVCNEKITPNRLESILIARGINGVLIPPQPFQPDWGTFRWERFSTVRFGRSLTTPCTNVVMADQVANAMVAVQKVQQRGYKRIGFVSKPVAGWLFEAGFLRGQLEIDERSRLPMFAVDPVKPQLSQAGLIRWLQQKKPDAILTACSELPDMIKKAGYRLPDDIGMATMSVLDGNIDAGIYQNPEEIGRSAVLMLNSMIHENAPGIRPIHCELLVAGEWRDGLSLPTRK